MTPGTQGYADAAMELIPRYQQLAFTYKHEDVMHLLPQSPVDALDVGAGTGVDASWLASQGHRVVAAEPTAQFRAFGIANHQSPLITWVDDALPLLSGVAAVRNKFDLVMLTAVWMHLSKQERAVGMPVLARLLSPSGVIIMALRHGPVPAGRVMFAVSAEETIDLAAQVGLRCVFKVHTESRQEENRHAGVTWSRLAFSWASPPPLPSET